MTAVDWNEVKRLAADFQRAQLSSTSQSLSERNCIEIITKLIELNLLDVIFTTDGKEYITPQHLIKEIKDELYVHGGRVNLVELARLLNVDLSQVSARAAEIERSHPGGYQLVLGQLIDKSYSARVAEEVNERLRQQGQIDISDLTRQYDLPSDFLQTLVEKQLGKAIVARQDKEEPRIFFTDAFVECNKAIVRGALTAITTPTSVTAILNQCDMQERVFYSVVDGLMESKEIAGIVNGKHSGSATYVPHVYSRQQNEWVESFYRQNGYLEYDAMSRLGISEPQGFARRHFTADKPLLLSSCAVGRQLLSQVEGAVDEALATGSWIDIMTMLPSVFEPEDGEEVLKAVLKSGNSKVSVLTFCNTILVTEKFLEDVCKPFHDQIIQKKAEEVVNSGAYISAQAEIKLGRSIGGGVGGGEMEDSKADRREERRRKATGGKGGGGTQGRETKTKSTKKKYQPGKGGRGDDSEEEDTPKRGGGGRLELISLKEIKSVLANNPALQEGELEKLIDEVATYLHPLLNKEAVAAAAEAYESKMASSSQSRRRAHADLQERLTMALNDLRLYDKGIRQLAVSNKEAQVQLARYLLKTVGAGLVNMVFAYVGRESCAAQGDSNTELNAEARSKILSEVAPEMREPLSKLHKSLNGTVDEFLAAVEPAFTVADLVVRKPDKKKDRPQLLAHRHALLEQLMQAQDPALVLHLATLVLFQAITQTMLHASGRFVSLILPFLGAHLAQSEFDMLNAYHDLVLKQLTTAEESEEYAEVKKKLQEGAETVRNIAVNFKRNAVLVEKITS